MAAQDGSVKQTKILDDLIDNAVGLPIDSQNLLLMMAKAMRFTRECMTQKASDKQPPNPTGMVHKSS